MNLFEAEVSHCAGVYQYILLERYKYGKLVMVVMKTTIAEDGQSKTEFVVVRDNELYASYPLISFAVTTLNELVGE